MPGAFYSSFMKYVIEMYMHGAFANRCFITYLHYTKAIQI